LPFERGIVVRAKSVDRRADTLVDVPGQRVALFGAPGLLVAGFPAVGSRLLSGGVMPVQSLPGLPAAHPSNRSSSRATFRR
jgi:hypothetical protein